MVKKLLVNIPDDFETPEQPGVWSWDSNNKCLECRFYEMGELGDCGWCVLTDDGKCPFYGDDDLFVCDIRI